jgi:hypothetical protein
VSCRVCLWWKPPSRLQVKCFMFCSPFEGQAGQKAHIPSEPTRKAMRYGLPASQGPWPESGRQPSCCSFRPPIVSGSRRITGPSVNKARGGLDLSLCVHEHLQGPKLRVPRQSHAAW